MSRGWIREWECGGVEITRRLWIGARVSFGSGQPRVRVRVRVRVGVRVRVKVDERGMIMQEKGRIGSAS